MMAPPPRVRGQLATDVELARFTFFRVGGRARLQFYPADAADLAEFLRQLDPSTAVLPLGVASNVLVRDGGIDGAVIRLGKGFKEITVEGETLIAGAAVLDENLARTAQQAGLSGLEFFSGIPGTVGGAVRMNAGAFGGETADRLLWAEVMDRHGRVARLGRDELGLAYRASALPADSIVLRAAFRLHAGDPDAIRRRMEAIKKEREATQPIGVATGGSTFKNPPGLRAWQLIEAAGCRGLVWGRAKVSEKHCNFLINTGGATAAEIEALGEEVRKRVRLCTGVDLEWEIHRVGQSLSAEAAG